MGKLFINDNQLEEWVEAALGIQHQFGSEKALGYLIGEKVYNLVDTLYTTRKIARFIEEEQRKPHYKLIREITLKKNDTQRTLTRHINIRNKSSWRQRDYW